MRLFQKGVATTFDDQDLGDVALLALSRQLWFRVWCCLSFGLAASELVLVAYADRTLTAQKAVLAVSSAFSLLGYFATVLAMPVSSTQTWRECNMYSLEC